MTNRNEVTVALTWRRDQVFEGGAEGKPPIVVDGEGSGGPSPVETLLLAVAGCTGADVVEILGKMRVRVASCRVVATGTRREEPPRRYVAIRLGYELRGEGIDEVKVRRAIDLSLEKYCSVAHSLALDIATSYELVLV